MKTERDARLCVVHMVTVGSVSSLVEELLGIVCMFRMFANDGVDDFVLEVTLGTTAVSAADH